MELKHDYWTGEFDDILSLFVNCVSEYCKDNNALKVGITNNPERRINEYKALNEGWRKMLVKYETGSVHLVNILEEILANCHYEYNSNIRGEVSDTHKTPPYYLYIVIK